MNKKKIVFLVILLLSAIFATAGYFLSYKDIDNFVPLICEDANEVPEDITYEITIQGKTTVVTRENFYDDLLEDYAFCRNNNQIVIPFENKFLNFEEVVPVSVTRNNSNETVTVQGEVDISWATCTTLEGDAYFQIDYIDGKLIIVPRFCGE